MFGAGDGLRGLGALCVAVVHVFYFGAVFTIGRPEMDVYGALPEIGLRSLELALLMFFALSGYLITRPFGVSFVEGRRSPALGRYAVRRVARILPTLVAVSLLAMFVLAPSSSSLDEYLSVVLLLQTWNWSEAAASVGPAWSLAVEANFYVLVPLLFALATAVPAWRTASRRARITAGVTVLLVLGVLSVLARGADPGLAWGTSLPATVCVFAIGMACAVAFPVLGPWLGSAPAVRARAVEALAWVVTLTATALYALHVPEGIMRPFMFAGSADAAAAVAAGSGLVVALLVRQARGAGTPGVLLWRPVVWVGERSLPFYLVHQGVIIFVARRTDLGAQGSWKATAILAVAALPLSLVLAAVVHRLVERPGMQVGEAWLARRRAPVPPPLARPL